MRPVARAVRIERRIRIRGSSDGNPITIFQREVWYYGWYKIIENQIIPIKCVAANTNHD